MSDDWEGLTARLDPDIWDGLEIKGQTFDTAPYCDLSDRPQFGMSDEAFAAYAEAEAKDIDRFTSEVEAGEWEPTCDDSVGPRTFEEAKARNLDRPPFGFTPSDFEAQGGTRPAVEEAPAPDE